MLTFREALKAADEYFVRRVEVIYGCLMKVDVDQKLYDDFDTSVLKQFVAKSLNDDLTWSRRFLFVPSFVDSDPVIIVIDKPKTEFFFCVIM